jgi:hypothetical protein
MSSGYMRYFEGILQEQLVDNGDGTGTKTVFNTDGSAADVQQISGLPVQQFPPLDATGALATLLVVLNIIPIEDAANVIHEEPAHLIAEAEAWSLG